MREKINPSQPCKWKKNPRQHPKAHFINQAKKKLDYHAVYHMQGERSIDPEVAVSLASQSRKVAFEGYYTERGLGRAH